MKTAKLHDGQVLNFEDDVPDGLIHRAVRDHLGMGPPDPPMEHQMAQQQLGTLQQVAQQLDLLGDVTAHLEQVGERLNGVAKRLDSVLHALADVREGVGALPDKIVTPLRKSITDLTLAVNDLADGSEKRFQRAEALITKGT